MAKTKSIPADKVDILIKELQSNLIRINEISQEAHWGAPSKALGYAEGTIEITIKKLKGDYPITLPNTVTF